MSSEYRGGGHRERRGRGRLLAAYGPLFALPSARRLVGTSLLARAPIAAVDLPLILLAQDVSGSYAVAGLALGVRSAAAGLTAPLRGRMIDRHGVRRAVPPLVVASAAVTAALPGAAELEAAWLIVLLAALTGALAPALPAAMRVEWRRLLGGEAPLLERAYALESSAQVGLYVVGPLAAGAGLALAGASATLLGAALLLFVAGLAFAAVAGPAAQPDEPTTKGLGPIRLPRVRRVVVAVALADMTLGAVDVAVAAFAQERGRPGAAGVLLALFALSSIAAGVAYGARRWHSPPEKRLVGLLAAGAVATVPLALADSLLALAALLVLAGAPSAAQWATGSTAIDRAAPGAMAAEAYNWFSTANAAGVALGAALAGVLVEAEGTWLAFVAAAAAPALAAGYLAHGPGE
jgi:MFS family permease